MITLLSSRRVIGKAQYLIEIVSKELLRMTNAVGKRMSSLNRWGTIHMESKTLQVTNIGGQLRARYPVSPGDKRGEIAEGYALLDVT
jgi:hypothetical protein